MQLVAGPAVVQLRPRAAVRAAVGGRQVPGAHAEQFRGETAQRDPAGDKILPGCRVLDARGTRPLGRIEEGPCVRTDVGKTNGPDGYSGNGDGSAEL
ncbi:hypothetical protein J2X01_000837 [Arthrobacter ginsengisoli]|uniref:AMP-dependent synthetase/ligase domain-containing protein n=1 Tax=Arthrobacter ginsengisoli TaxID=1356565 RepID=A0ABU1U8P9_9MICC|nr:hypothetical protein [Arthrobacter ginsengisoli]